LFKIIRMAIINHKLL